MNGWIWMKPGLLGDLQEGPLADSALLQLAFDGAIKPKTLVCHPVHTRGQWVHMEKIPAARQKYEEGTIARQQAEQQRRQQEEERRQRQRETIAQHNAATQSANPITRFLADGQNASVVARIYDGLTQILTDQETIEYIAVQAKVSLVAADCAVATNRRFIIYRPTMLGQLTFEDHLWIYLHNAHLKEGMLYSELAFQTIQSRWCTIGYLPKPQARHLYRICQQREEQMLQARYDMHLAERRAGAANIVVNAPAQSAPQPAVPESDSVARLAKLKQMLDAGLISQPDYEQQKCRILNDL